MNTQQPDLQNLSRIAPKCPTGVIGTAGFDGDDPSWAVVATDMRQRMTDNQELQTGAKEDEVHEKSTGGFFPQVARSFRNTGLRESNIEALVLKYLLNCGRATGREISEQLGLPFGMMERMLHSMKMQQLLVIRSDAPLGDFSFELTEFGTDRARRFAQQCTYFGTAPVPLEQYANSVFAQTVQGQKLTIDDIRTAFQGLVLSDTFLGRLGEAVNMGRGMFLSGAAGNGKSTIAEQVANAYSPCIWIPRAIIVGGEIIRMYDPIHHEIVEISEDDTFDVEQLDRRWVRIRRPTISLGGELELASFDVHTNNITGISEAPIQLKSNCGTLVIDDFGRHRFRPEELLNRLVVPLERQSDNLQLSSGRTFRVPFDCMVVFASNMNPAELVDEAFLRRIPYVIDVVDPTDEEFRAVFERTAARWGIEFTSEELEHLLGLYQRDGGRPKRFCHPRDILSTIRNACDFHGVPPKATVESIDAAFASLAVLRTKLPV